MTECRKKECRNADYQKTQSKTCKSSVLVCNWWPCLRVLVFFWGEKDLGSSSSLRRLRKLLYFLTWTNLWCCVKGIMGWHIGAILLREISVVVRAVILSNNSINSYLQTVWRIPRISTSRMDRLPSGKVLGSNFALKLGKKELWTSLQYSKSQTLSQITSC